MNSNRSDKKERYRKTDPNWKSKQRKKKIAKLKHQQRMLSRKKRDILRADAMEYFDRFRNLVDRPLLFIASETDNMETIVFSKNPIRNNRYILSLPIINAEMIQNFCQVRGMKETSNTELAMLDDKKIMADIIEYFFQIRAEVIENVQNQNLTIIKNLKVHKRAPNSISLNVRPYDFRTWFSSDATSIAGGHKIYGGNNLKTFFQINKRDAYNTYVLQDTISQIIIYRILFEKLDHGFVKHDYAALAKRKVLNPKGLYITVSDSHRVSQDDLAGMECQETSQLIKEVRS